MYVPGETEKSHVVLDVVHLTEYASEQYPLLAKQATDAITFPRNVRFSNSY